MFFSFPFTHRLRVRKVRDVPQEDGADDGGDGDAGDDHEDQGRVAGQQTGVPEE